MAAAAAANPALAAWLDTRSSGSPRDETHPSLHLSPEAVKQINRDLDRKERELREFAEELAQRYHIDRHTRQRVHHAEVRLQNRARGGQSFQKPEGSPALELPRAPPVPEAIVLKGQWKL